jgi:hypothetical protein
MLGRVVAEQALQTPISLGANPPIPNLNQSPFWTCNGELALTEVNVFAVTLHIQRVEESTS